MCPDPVRDLLLQIASQGVLTLADPLSMDRLLEQGLVRRADAPRVDGLRTQYEAFQERHSCLLEAKALLDRLQAPRKGLSRWLSGGTDSPSREELPLLHALLATLGIQVRDAETPEELLPRLERVRDHLLVEDRDCMDRLAGLDREIQLQEKQGTETVRVESFGYVALSEKGRGLLPETRVMEDVESVFNLVSGPRRQKIVDYDHFRKDPATLLAFVLASPSRAEVVDTFEALAEALERVRDLQDFRHRNALIIRLMRCFRKEPRQAHLWCARERLQELGTRTEALLPPSLTRGSLRYPLGVDLFLAGPGSPEPNLRFEERQRLMESVLNQLRPDLSFLQVGEATTGLLGLGLMHEALRRQVSGPVLAGRLVKRMLGVSLEAMAQAPPELGEPSVRLMAGFHLAHWADFQAPRLPGVLESYRGLAGALDTLEQRKTLPVTVVLHALGVLEGLKSLGCPVEPSEYLGTLQRILQRLRSHRDLSRAFQAEHLLEEELLLAANLSARAYFPRVESGAGHLPGLGVAAAYEAPDQGAPLLGHAFGGL